MPSPEVLRLLEKLMLALVLSRVRADAADEVADAAPRGGVVGGECSVMQADPPLTNIEKNAPPLVPVESEQISGTPHDITGPPAPGRCYPLW